MRNRLTFLLIFCLIFSFHSNVSAIPLTKSSVHTKNIPTIRAIFADGNKMFVLADRHIKASVMRLKDPERLVLTIPNAQLDRTFVQPIYIPDKHPTIRNIRYATFSNQPPTVRVVADLHSEVDYSFSNEANDSLVVSLDDQVGQLVLDESSTPLQSPASPSASPSVAPVDQATPSPTVSPVATESSVSPSPITLVGASVERPLIKMTFNQPIQVISGERTGEIQRLQLSVPLSEPASLDRLSNLMKQSIRIKGIKDASWLPDPEGKSTFLDLTIRPGYALTIQSNAKQTDWTIQVKAVKAKIVIDAGHGGRDVGAISLRKSYEKNYALDVALMVQKELANAPGIEVIMTRSDDRFLTLDERAAFAKLHDADLFISIHGNSNERRSIRGTETYYFSKDSYAFAKTLHEHIVRAAKLPDRKVRSAKFIVLRNNTVPSALLELGYLSNALDEAQLMSTPFQQRVSKSISEGIINYANEQLVP